jgi:hypothetical protein
MADDNKEDRKVGTTMVDGQHSGSDEERIQATGFILHHLSLEDVSKMLEPRVSM